MDKEKLKVAWWQPGMELFLKLSGWIGGPVIVGVFVGKYLDRKYGTAPWLFLGCVGFSFVISMVALIYIGFKEIKKIEKEERVSKPEK